MNVPDAVGSRLSEDLARVLVFIQSHVEEDLSLQTLARVAHLSPFHFHRTFRALIGESVKAYVQRIRLERSAIRLLLHDGPILGVALDSGFQSHETFSRAFRRRFKVGPREFRGRAPRRARSIPNQEIREGRGSSGDFALSRTRTLRLAESHLACLRHVGPYDQVPPGLWDRLRDWARRSGVPAPFVLIGIAHDAPGITAPERLRFDAAIRIPAPLPLKGDIFHQTMPSGPFALTTFAGPMENIARAYKIIFRRLERIRGYQVLGLPSIELYRSTQVTPEWKILETDIYVPLRERMERSTR